MEMNQKDWEALSAYLDNQLTVRERQALESRLGSEPALQAALADLRRTQAILRRAAPVRAPRNFTLTPEMVGQRSRQHPAFPVFRLAMVVASLLFVLVFSGDLVGVIPGVTPAFSTWFEPVPVEDMASRPMGGGGGMGMGGGGGGPIVAAPQDAVMEESAKLALEAENNAADSAAVEAVPETTETDLAWTRTALTLAELLLLVVALASWAGLTRLKNRIY